MNGAPQDWKAAQEELRAHDSYIVACHVNPDGDALGSLFGTALILKRLGKTVHASWGATPPQIPQGYGFLPATELLTPPHELPEASCFVAVDCGAADRLGMLEERARGSQMLVNIDHHRGNDEFGKVNVVDPDASSTAEMLARLFLDMDIELDLDIATCLYTGILTDTGSFRYTNSTPETLRLAADLLEFGVDKTAIAQEVFETSPFGYLQLLARVLGRATLFEEERFICSTITHHDLRATGVVIEETDKVIDILRSTRDADVAVIFKEQGDGAFRGSLRSRGRINVGSIARARGGGGHDLAAGFTTQDVDAAVEEIRSEVAAQIAAQ